jgi:N6-L-threonylcarbamoyladenine synthase
MIVLGIETSCDECAAAIVSNGVILSNVVATQIPFHAPWQGVVPEIASRMHTEWIYRIAEEALRQAGLTPADVEGAAATAHPGLLGSLLVGLHFAKAFAWARGIPFIAVDHLLAHLYASRLNYPDSEGGPVSKQSPSNLSSSSPAPLRSGPANGPVDSPSGISAYSSNFMGSPAGLRYPPEYPFLGLLVSGGHSVICRADNFDDITVMGTTIDDAAGEAFDKVAKFYSLGYPGGIAIDKLAREGNSETFAFPMPNLYKPGKDGNDHRYDVSYSGLKTAVVNQLEQFRVPDTNSPELTTEFHREKSQNPLKTPCNSACLRLPVADRQTGRQAVKNLKSASSAPLREKNTEIPPDTNPADIAASFQKTAVEILLRALFRAVEDTGLRTIVAGGGVAANSYLRARLAEYAANNSTNDPNRQEKPLQVIFPPPELCGDNAAMVAGLGEQYLLRGDCSPLNVTASARVHAFKKRYP